MEPAGQPSFIPHDAGTPQVRRSSEGGLWDLLLMLGIVVLAVSCALAAGVFLYQQYQKASINSSLAKIQEAKRQFDPNLVDQLTRLDNRMHSADVLLATHLAPSAFFAALDQVTLQTVSYKSLEMQVTDPRHITVMMGGVARSVNSIAYQADVLSSSGVFTSPIFSNLDRQKEGVHFKLTSFLDASKINFAMQLSSAGATMPAAPLPVSPAASSSPGGMQQ